MLFQSKWFWTKFTLKQHLRRMCCKMRFQIFLHVELLLTDLAGKILFNIFRVMSFLVGQLMCGLCELLWTNNALVWFFTGVISYVHNKGSVLFERFPTMVALERGLSCMKSFVCFERIFAFAEESTICTFERFLWVLLFVLSKNLLCFKRWWTYVAFEIPWWLLNVTN